MFKFFGHLVQIPEPDRAGVELSPAALCRKVLYSIAGWRVNASSGGTRGNLWRRCSRSASQSQHCDLGPHAEPHRQANHARSARHVELGSPVTKQSAGILELLGNVADRRSQQRQLNLAAMSVAAQDQIRAR